MDGDVVFFNPHFEDVFSDVGFEDPHGAVVTVDGGAALASVAVGFAFLPFPC